MRLALAGLLATTLVACGSRQATEPQDAGVACDGQMLCGGFCVDTKDDPRHCGGCDVACASGLTCVAGACTLRCPAGFTDCGGTCRDLQLDPAACGSCGVACDKDLVCSKGTCSLECRGGSVKCGDRCTTLDADPLNCGACGTKCPKGAICSGRSCNCPSTASSTCADECVDLASDRRHCGACGAACPSGPCLEAPTGATTKAPTCLRVKAVGLSTYHGCLVAEAGTELRPFCWGTNRMRTTAPTDVAVLPVPLVADKDTTFALQHSPHTTFGFKVGQDLAMLTLDVGFDSTRSLQGLFGWGQWSFALPESHTSSGYLAEHLSPHTDGRSLLAVGAKHYCVSLDALAVLGCFGDNSKLQLGVETTSGYSAPVPFYKGHLSLSAYGDRTCTVHSSNVYCWGGSFGLVSIQLYGRAEPEVHVGDTIQCLRSLGRELSCWGSGVLGDGLAAHSASAPVRLGQTFDQVSLGGSSCGIDAGEVYCWGPGTKGQIGDGALVDRLVPTKVKGLTNVTMISVADTAACAVNKDGAVYCWGENVNARLGKLAKDGINADPVQLVFD